MSGKVRLPDQKCVDDRVNRLQRALAELGPGAYTAADLELELAAFQTAGLAREAVELLRAILPRLEDTRQVPCLHCQVEALLARVVEE